MGWKIGGAVCLVLAGIAALITATTSAEYLTGAEWVFAVVLAVLAVIFFRKGAKSGAQKRGRGGSGNGTFMTEQDLQQIQAGGLPALSGVPVILAEGEVAHFFAPARRAVTKKKAIGRTGKSGGVSVRVAKGVSVRSGGGASRTVYNDVTDFFEGQVVLTNRRIVFLAKQGGFDCKLDAISAITPEGDRIMVQAGKDAYRLSVPQQGHFMKVLDMVVRA